MLCSGIGGKTFVCRVAAWLTSASCATLLITQPALALPKNPKVVRGKVAVSSSGNSMTVSQRATSQNKAVVNWSSFNIGSNETVTFQQPNSSSLIVNRVTGTCTSVCHSILDGRVAANGNVMLINPNGILFGAGARVDVNGLAATTIDFTNDALMATGPLTSNVSTNSQGFVINNGAITVNAGLAALVAPGVVNNGTILARAGKVALASGRKYTIDFHGDGMVQLAMGADFQTNAAVSAPMGNLGAAVANHGSIIADGGTILLTARAAEGVVDNVINMSGVIQARSVSTANGKVVLHGGDANNVQVTGLIDTSGGPSLAGGTVHILGEKVTLGERVLVNGVAAGLQGGAIIDVSGGAGGGRLFVGGDDNALPLDRSGAGGVKMAVETVISKGTQIKASGGTGAPGQVNVTGYVEYHEGNIPLIVTTAHGGTLKPTYIADRNCTGVSNCSVISDSKTQELSSELLNAVQNLTGERPHWIVVNLHRSKLDANRPTDFEDGTSEEALKAHDSTHALIGLSTRIVQDQHGGRGLLIDIHGTAHDQKGVELGYVVPGSVLNTYSDTELNASRYATTSSIAALGRDSRALTDAGASPNIAQVLRGDLSLGALLSKRTDAYGEAYRVVPSPANPGPGEHPYYSGGYIVQRHGSGGSVGPSAIDAIQMEATQHYRINGDASRNQFAQDLGASLVEFLRLNYGLQ